MTVCTWPVIVWRDIEGVGVHVELVESGVVVEGWFSEVDVLVVESEVWIPKLAYIISKTIPMCNPPNLPSKKRAHTLGGSGVIEDFVVELDDGAARVSVTVAVLKIVTTIGLVFVGVT